MIDISTKAPVLPIKRSTIPVLSKSLLASPPSDALTALGPHCLVIASKADSTAPEAAQGRMVLLRLPLCADEDHHAEWGTSV